MPRRERLDRRLKRPPLSGGLGSFRDFLPLLVVLAFGGLAASLSLQLLAVLGVANVLATIGVFALIPPMFPLLFAALAEALRLGWRRVPGEGHGSAIDPARALRGVRRAEWIGVAALGAVAALLALLSVSAGLVGAASGGDGPPVAGSFAVIVAIPYGLSALQLLSAYRVPPEPEGDDPSEGRG